MIIVSPITKILESTTLISVAPIKAGNVIVVDGIATGSAGTFSTGSSAGGVVVVVVTVVSHSAYVTPLTA